MSKTWINENTPCGLTDGSTGTRGQVHPSVKRLRMTCLIALLVMTFVLIPALNLLGVIDDHNVNRLGRYLCFAIAALGIDLIWGYTGVLSLGQALPFCLGAYAMAMHLSLPQGGGDVRPEYNSIPQFFFFNNVESLPQFWKPFSSFPFALAVAILLPSLLAAVFGLFIFKSRVRGVFFAIITQAVALAAFLAFCRNELLLGGTNGLTNFHKSLNTDQSWILGLYLISAAVLVLAMLACRFIVRSRLGRVLVAIRDNESRLRFSGYRPEYYKVFAFAVAAALAAIAGVLYVPQNGIVTPNIMRAEDSILFVIWVALGGRGRLWGAVFGALAVNYAYSTLTSDAPSTWPFVQGAMFLTVVLVPSGLIGLWDCLEQRLAARRGYLAAALPLLTIFAFVAAEALGLMPTLLQTLVMGVELKYVVLTATLLGWGLYEKRQLLVKRCGSWLASLRFLAPASSVKGQ